MTHHQPMRYIPRHASRLRLHPRQQTQWHALHGNYFRSPQPHPSPSRGTRFEVVKKYGVTRLVWFEEYPLYADAIQRETSLKRWKRDWKLALIEEMNPDWNDLLETWNS